MNVVGSTMTRVYPVTALALHAQYSGASKIMYKLNIGTMMQYRYRYSDFCTCLQTNAFEYRIVLHAYDNINEPIHYA